MPSGVIHRIALSVIGDTVKTRDDDNAESGASLDGEVLDPLPPPPQAAPRAARPISAMAGINRACFANCTAWVRRLAPSFSSTRPMCVFAVF